MADNARVNGNQFSWASVILKINGERFYGFTSVAWDEKRERILAYGMGRHHAPRGKSAGKYTPGPLKLTGWKGSMQAAKDALAARASDGISYGNVEFEVVVQIVEPGETPITVQARRCTWAANTSSHEENPDPLKDDAEIQPMFYRVNGKTLYDSSQGQP